MLDFLLITVLICVITLWLQSKPLAWRGKGIPWILPLPLFGNTSQLLIKSWPQFWKEFYNSIKNEKVYGFHYFSTPALLIKDPALLKKVMITDADHFSERETGTSERDPLSKSLFFTKGQTWKNQRAKMTPYFTPARIKSAFPYLRTITDKFVQCVVQESKKGPVDMQMMSLKLSTDVTMSNIFGLEPECFDNPNSFFFALQKELVNFLAGLRGLLYVMAPRIYNLLRLTSYDSLSVAKLSSFINDIITQRSKGIGVRPDFIQGMIELMAEDDKESSQDNKQLIRFDKTTVLAQCMIMYEAGTETTGNTLSFILYELALHQDVQDRLRDEIISMIKTTSNNYGVDDLQKLKYMDQVISETLRIYPVGSVVGRKCTSPYTLNGLDIPVGTIISIPIVAIHHDPNNFPDPLKFDPERFSADASIIPGTYLPFGQGPRTCIGMKLAMAEIQLSLCLLLSKYKVKPSHNTTIPMQLSQSPIISSGTPIWLHVEPI